MKKRNFWFGCAYIMTGIGFFVAFLLTDTIFDSLFLGFTGGMLGAGLGLIGKYAYWSRPKRQEEYARRLEHEQICMKDERLQMLRDRAKSRAFTVGLYVVSISMVVFCILDTAEVPVTWSGMILYLIGFVVLEFIIYTSSYNKLESKY